MSKVSSAAAVGEKKPSIKHDFLIHNPGDHVGVATSNIKEGEKVIGVNMGDNSTVEVVAKGNIPYGHKIALQALDLGTPVLKYGIEIGVTTQRWEQGDYVHTHNIKTQRW
ncbi:MULTISPECIES: UxaA family hydrolase [unclassified Bacillus (in: firmicutes)]|uniref:UxaA family hydrolase n=1 Tax=unclassified Bacillus (in: firmicutes) TaxID=185979 RepID=UPI003000050D